MLQIFNEIEVIVHETHDSKQWYMTVEEVARGYGVAYKTILNHLTNHADEIRDGVKKGSQNLGPLSKNQEATNE